MRLVHSACIYFIRMAAALIQIFVKKTGQLTINCIVSTQTHTFLNTFPFCTNASNIFKNFPIFLSIQFFNNFFHNFSCRARRYTEPKTCYWLFIQTHTQLFCMCFFFYISNTYWFVVVHTFAQFKIPIIFIIFFKNNNTTKYLFFFFFSKSPHLKNTRLVTLTTNDNIQRREFRTSTNNQRQSNNKNVVETGPKLDSLAVSLASKGCVQLEDLK